MKAIVLDGYGDIEKMRWGEADTPQPLEGQVLIRVMATSVNGADLAQRRGLYPPPPGESEILGLEVSGIIAGVGAGVSGWSPGERVMSLVAGGAYAEYALAWASHLLPIPASLSFEQAACVCETYVTAYLNLFLIAGLKENETALLHGGGGGVNTAAIQLCRMLAPSCRIIVTASPGKIEGVRRLGVDRVVDYRASDFAAATREFTKGRGVDVILDHIGGAYLTANQKSLAVEGRLVVIGVSGGVRAELNLGVLLVKRQRIIGSVLRARSVSEKAGILSRFGEQVLPGFVDGRLVPVIDRVLPLQEAREGHRVMEESRHFGKIVLQVAESD